MADSQIYQLGTRTLALTDVFPTQDVGGTAAAGKNTVTEMKATMLLNNVDNTSDANKPVSTAQAVAIAAAISVLNVKVSVSSAEILALFTTPKQLVAAPGAGLLIVPLAISKRLNYGSIAYTTNLNLRTRMNGTLTQDAGILGLSGNAYSLQPLAGGVFSADLSNTALTLDVAIGNPAAGDSTLDIYVTYTIVTI